MRRTQPCRTRRKLSTVLLLLAMALARGAQCADQTIFGSVLMLKNPSTSDKRKIIVKAREIASDNTIVGDPVADGATLTVVAHGGGGAAATRTCFRPA